MKLKSIFTDEDAVSPVIGVILMVAITVILAAVIGAFVLGIGGSQEQTPQASWEWEQTTVTTDDDTTTVEVDAFELKHQGGGAVTASELSVTVNGNQAWGVEPIATSNDKANRLFGASGAQTGDVTAGNSVTVAFYDDGSGTAIDDGTDIEHDSGNLKSPSTEISSGDTLRLVWSSSESDTTQVLADYTF